MANDLVHLPVDLRQVSFADAEFAENPEMRCPCLLLLDSSLSMDEDGRIADLNNGIVALKDDLVADPMASKRVEIATVSYGGRVRVVNDFVPVEGFHPPRLHPAGDTPMAAAIVKGLELLRARKDLYRKNAISYYRPWVWLITDGAPTDSDGEIEKACEMVRRGEEEKAFSFFACGVKGADFAMLRRISVRDPLRIRETSFREMFRWLSSSLSAVSRSQPNVPAPLANPTVPNGWADVG